MKKFIKIALSVALCVAMVFAFTACTATTTIKPKDYFKKDSQMKVESEYTSSKTIAKDSLFTSDGSYAGNSSTFSEDGVIFYYALKDGAIKYGACSVGGENTGLKFDGAPGASGYGMFIAGIKGTDGTIEYGIYNVKGTKLVPIKGVSGVKFYSNEYFMCDKVMYKVQNDTATAIIGSFEAGGSYATSYASYNVYKDCIIGTNVPVKAAFDKNGKKLSEVIVGTNETFRYIGEGKALIQKEIDVPSDEKDYTYYDSVSSKKIKITNRVFNFKKGTSKEIKMNDFLLDISSTMVFAESKDLQFTESLSKKYANAVCIAGQQIVDKQLQSESKVKTFNSSMKSLGGADSYRYLGKVATDRYLAINSNGLSDVLDGKGNLIVSLGSASPKKTSNGLAFAVNGKLGAVDADGKVITPFEYENAMQVGDYAVGVRDGKIYSVDLTTNTATQIVSFGGYLSSVDGIYTDGVSCFNFAGRYLYAPSIESEKISSYIGEFDGAAYFRLNNGNILSFTKTTN